MNLAHLSGNAIDEVVTRSLQQILRFVRFDGAVLFTYASDLNLLWPLACHGDFRGRISPAVPGMHLVGSAFESVAPLIMDESEIAAGGGAWLRAEGATSAIALPLFIGPEKSGVLAIFSRRAIQVDQQTLRGLAIFAAHLNAAMRRAPLLVTADIQRHQIEALTRIIAAATGPKMADTYSLYEEIATEARLLTGAQNVAIERPEESFAFAEHRDGKTGRRSFPQLLKRRIAPSSKRKRTVMRRALKSHDLVLSLSWQSVFQPTDRHWQLVDLIVCGLEAVEDVRARVLLAERERRAQYLADVGRALAVSLDLSVVLATIQSLFVPTSADCVIVDLVDSAKSDGSAVSARSMRDEERILDIARAPATASLIARGIMVAQPLDPPLGGDLAELVIAPMFSDDRFFGSVIFGRTATRGPLGNEEREHYRELASYACTAVKNATSYLQEHAIADVLQRSLLPTNLPKDERLLFDASYVPAGAGANVGGDWYDVFSLDPERFAVSIGDVGGHGILAATTMNVVRLAFRAAALGGSHPLDVLERGDAMLRLEQEPPLVTALYGIVDLRRNMFSYACAGHPPPVLVSANREPKNLPKGGIPLGIGFGIERDFFEVALEPGDALVLYTDGLVEYARDAITGEARLHTLVSGLIEKCSRTTLARDLHSATFSDGGAQHDDVAVLTIALRPKKREMQWQMPAVPASAPLLRRALTEFWNESPSWQGDSGDFLVATGEAIANSVEHAYPHSDGTVSVRASYDPTGVRVEIADRGKYKMASVNSERGFGTTIMRALAKEVNISGNEQGTLVQLAFR